jgi:hypothetical protein
VQGLIRRAVAEWGYGYLKLDGLHIGMSSPQSYPSMHYVEDFYGDAALADKSMSNMQAARAGLHAVREAAGAETFILGCCVPQNERSLGMVLGLVDAMRVGPDNGPAWEGIVTGARSVSRLYFLNGRVWWNDPDPIYARSAVPLNELVCFGSWVTLLGALHATSDWAPDYPPERMDVLRRMIPSHQLTTVRLVDFLAHDPARIWVLTYRVGKERHDVIGLFNWGDEPWQARVEPASAGLDAAAEYDGFDFWAATPVERFQILEQPVPPRTCRVIAVRAVTEAPRLVSSSRHVTQGAVELLAERWDPQSQELSGTSRVVGGEVYELRVALRGQDTLWEVTSADLTGEGARPGVLTAVTGNGEWARLRIQADKSGLATWRIRCRARDAGLGGV